MHNQMTNKSHNRVLLTILLVALLALVAILAAFWIINVFNQQFPDFQQRRPSSGFIPFDLEFFYVALTVVSTLNIALLVLLIALYVDIYRKTKSPFTIGLVIFAGVFLVKDLTASPLLISLLGYRASGLGPFAFIPGLFEFFALVVLLYLSIKY